MSEADRQALDIRERLRAALRAGIRNRDPVATSALRSALAAIANAEAVTTDSVPAAATSSPHVAGAAPGLGAGEVARRSLTETALADIVRTEIAEREQAADQYAQAGRADRAKRLRGEAGAILAALESQKLA